MLMWHLPFPRSKSTFVNAQFSRQTPDGLIGPKQLWLLPKKIKAQAEPQAVNPKGFSPWRIPSPDTFSHPSHARAPGEFIAHFMSYWVGWTRDLTVIEFLTAGKISPFYLGTAFIGFSNFYQVFFLVALMTQKWESTPWIRDRKRQEK